MISKTLRGSEGGRLGLIEAGAGAPLVLLHGVGMCAAAWAPQIEAFAPARHVFALDLPGHGGTDMLPGAPLLPDYVAWAAAAIRALGAGPVALAGHSMGALIALGMAVEHPDLLDRVALLNPVHRRDAKARAAVLGRARDLAAGGGDPEAPLARWFGPEDASDIRARVGGWLRAVDPLGYARTYAAFAAGDDVYAGRLAAVRCPALVLTGAQDANSSPEMARAIAAGLAGGRAVVVPGARHMTSLTHPEAVNAELALWLGLPGDARGRGDAA